MELLNSAKNYAAAMNHVRALELKVAATERGELNPDFQKDANTIRELQAAALTQSKEGKVSIFSRADHSKLLKALDALTKRVDQASDLLLKHSQKDSPSQNLSWKRRVCGAALFAAALAFVCFRYFTIPSLNPISPVPHRGLSFQGRQGSSPSLVKLLSQNSPRHLNCSGEHSDLLDRSQWGLTKQRTSLYSNVTEWSQRRMDISPVLFPKTVQNDSREAKVDGLVPNKIATAAGNLVLLGALRLAGHALQNANPFFCLVAVNRVYKLARLSNTTLLEKLSPEYAENLRNATAVFDQIEALFPISASEILENMQSIDRWAAVGLLMQLPNFAGTSQMGAALPGGFLFQRAWSVLQWAPFVVNTQKSDQKNPAEAETRLIPKATALFDNPIKDLASAFYLILAGHALTQAAPFLALSATHQVFTILKETDQAGELKKNLPLFASLIEKSSQAYTSIESALPFSTTHFLLGLTDIDRWAMIGFMNLIRARFLGRGGNMRGLAFLLSNTAWRFIQFTPLFVGSGLSWFNSAIGLNPQVLSSVESVS